MMLDSFLSDAGWLFFTAWSAIVALVSLMAFGRDIFPSTTERNPSRKDPR